MIDSIRAARRRGIAALAALAACAVLPAAAQAPAPAEGAALAKIRAKGSISVAVYKDHAPYHDAGKGIDVDIAAAIASALGVRLQLLPFDAGDSLGDDLRNMVWRGHYLGYGPADLMIHVPYDRRIATEYPQVHVFGPYHVDRLGLARDADRVPSASAVDEIAAGRIGVQKLSYASQVVPTIEGGRLRDAISVFDDVAPAVQAMHARKVAAVAGSRTELEAALSKVADRQRFALDDMPGPGHAQRRWAPAFAVKKDSTDLAAAVERIVEGMLESGAVAKIFAAHGAKAVRP